MTQNVSGWLPNLLGPVELRDEGVAVTARPAIAFVGAGVTVTDDSSGARTVVTIPDAGAGPLSGVAGVLTRTATTTLDNGEAKTTGRDIIPTSIQTTDGTVTNLYTFTTTTSRVYVLRGLVSCATTTAAGYGLWSIEALFDNQGGTLTQRVASPVTTVAESSVALDVTVDASAGAIRVRVTGLAATNIRWTGRLYLHETAF
jgi:hypothetical protein